MRPMPWRWRLSKLEGRIGIWVRVTFLQRDRDQETEWLQCFLKMGGKHDRVQRAIHKMTTGMLTIYASTIGAEIQRPFGGTHHTGNGHCEADLSAIESFTTWKNIHIAYSGKLQRAETRCFNTPTSGASVALATDASLVFPCLALSSGSP